MFAGKKLAHRIEQLETELNALRTRCAELDATLQAERSILKSADDDRVAREIAEGVAYLGDDSNRLYRAFIGEERALSGSPQPVPFSSTLCRQVHFGLDQYRFWTAALKDRPRFLRKQWEFVFIAQSLYERGFLAGGKKGVVFGVGHEPLPALFASFGCEILATDQAAESAEQAGWIESSQHAVDLTPLNERQICTDEMFRALVKFAPVDMNNIPSSLDGQFDFCWSACSLEHLGSLENGLRFIEQSIGALRPGGLAVHTTEFNLTSNDETIEEPNLSIYRRRDIEAFLAAMAEKGHIAEPVDWTVGEGYAERVVDLPPFGRGEPHLRLRAGDYDMTSIGLIIRKAA